MGIKSTYAAGAPGEEFSSFQRAAQALNRYYGVGGEYVSPEVAKQEALSLRDPLKAAQALATNKAVAENLIRGELMKDYKVLNKETGKYELHPIAESFIQGAGVLHPNDVPEALQQIRPLIDQEHKIQLLNDPEKGKTLRTEIATKFLNGRNPKDLQGDEAKAYRGILEGTVTPQNYQKVWAPWLQAPRPGAAGGVTPAAPAAAATVPTAAAPAANLAEVPRPLSPEEETFTDIWRRNFANFNRVLPPGEPAPPAFGWESNIGWGGPTAAPTPRPSLADIQKRQRQEELAAELAQNMTFDLVGP